MGESPLLRAAYGDRAPLRKLRGGRFTIPDRCKLLPGETDSIDMSGELATAAPGRTCPLSYRYDPTELRRAAQLGADTLWIAGGLYGNSLALQCLVDAYAAEAGAKALVFNGDFHWFDVEPDEFELVNDTVLAFHATRGNIESELAAPQPDAGCGCAYPEWVGDATVEHSNRIIERLRQTARGCPGLGGLDTLPLHLVAAVAGVRIGIVHGDAGSLAGWSFSQEALATEEGCAAAERAFEAAHVDVFASSHTCLPVLRRFAHGRVIANNGSAGMANFRGETFGLATRISTEPSKDVVYRVRRGELFIEAVPLRYDAPAWQKRFLAHWPRGSSAYRSYWDRIVRGPDYHPRQALRAGG